MHCAGVCVREREREREREGEKEGEGGREGMGKRDSESKEIKKFKLTTVCAIYESSM